MPGNNSKNKGLLFNPSELLRLTSFLQILQITRKGNAVDFEMLYLSKQNIEKHFPHLPPEIQRHLLFFYFDEIDYEIMYLKSKRNKERSGIAENVFVEKGLIRYFHGLSQKLIQHLDQVNLFHRTQNPNTKNYAISKFTWNAAQPKISFRS